MIDITTLGEIPDPLKLAPSLGTQTQNLLRHLLIATLILIALFVLIWYIISKEEKTNQQNR